LARDGSSDLEAGDTGGERKRPEAKLLDKRKNRKGKWKGLGMKESKGTEDKFLDQGVTLKVKKGRTSPEN